jgi:hypothetical protein
MAKDRDKLRPGRPLHEEILEVKETASTSLARWAIGVGIVGGLLMGVGGPSSLVLAVASVWKRKRRQVMPWVSLAVAVVSMIWFVLVVVAMAQPSTNGGGYADNSAFAFGLGTIAVVLGAVTLLLVPSW